MIGTSIIVVGANNYAENIVVKTSNKHVYITEA